ncbi:MAG: DUF4173 domain-containing protein [Bacteroidia bacterium]
MKKINLLLLGATLSYSYLFYRESTGLNFFLFSVLLCSCCAWINPEARRNMTWFFAALGSLITGFAVLYMGNVLAVTGNILSLALLSAFTVEPRTSALSAWMYSAYSTVTSVVYMSASFFNYFSPTGMPAERQKRGLGIWVFILPLLALLFFFILYQQGNILFLDLTRKINLDFISMPWVLFSTGGFILMYSFFRYRTIPSMLEYEMKQGTNLERNVRSGKWIRKYLPLSQEYKSGVIMLALLNVLTLLVNILDFRFLFLNGKLPAGIIYSEFVHQGTGMLMVSIFFAIALLLFYFRAELNFTKGRRILLYLTYVWILQNIFMIVTCFMKNNLYIHEYGFTYKKIGVIVWLLLVLFGLITTGIKLWTLKTNYFLFRVNSWLVYGTLVVSTLFNWDKLIAEYNIGYAKAVDYSYLFTLSPNVLPPLMESYHKGKAPAEIKNYNDERMAEVREVSGSIEFVPNLKFKLSAFLAEQRMISWKSTCLAKDKLERELLPGTNAVH